MKLSTVKDFVIIGLVLFLFWKIYSFFHMSEDEKKEFNGKMQDVHDWKYITEPNEKAFNSSAEYIKKNGIVSYIKAYIKGEL